MKKTVLAVVSLILVLTAASGAFATTISVTNGLDLRVSVTVTYVDADSGALVTRGWWRVEPDGEAAITVNADESRGIYYAAYNRDQYMDSSTKGNPQIRRWASPRTFTYATDAEPSGEGVWQGRFYKINGSSVNIDSAR